MIITICLIIFYLIVYVFRINYFFSSFPPYFRLKKTSRSLPPTRSLPPSHCLFKIEAFSLLVDAKVNKYRSAPFEAGVLYPRGNIKANGSGFISLYLEIEKTENLSPYWEVNVEYKLFVFDKIRDQYLVIKGTNVPVRRFSKMNTSWGFSRFLSQKTFNNAANGYLVGDCCTFGAEVLVIQHPLKDTMYFTELTKTTRRLPPSHCLFKIEDFSVLLESKIDKKLVLYPSGNKKSNGSGFISLYLEIEKLETLSFDWEVNAEFKLSEAFHDSFHKKLSTMLPMVTWWIIAAHSGLRFW
ncbi:hypothetical protein GQ457_15G002840 [Hibiscus cannabinus]